MAFQFKEGFNPLGLKPAPYHIPKGLYWTAQKKGEEIPKSPMEKLVLASILFLGLMPSECSVDVLMFCGTLQYVSWHLQNAFPPLNKKAEKNVFTFRGLSVYRILQRNISTPLAPI